MVQIVCEFSNPSGKGALVSGRNEKKRQIVEAAFDVLMHEGLPAVSYERVARGLGQTRQGIRYHFPEPSDLALALCDYMAERYRELLVSGASNLPSAQRLDFFLDFYFDLLPDYPKPRDDQVYDAMFSLATDDPLVRKNLNGQYSLLGQVVSNEVQVQHPSLSRRDCEEISYLFVSLMYGHWKMAASLGMSEKHKTICRNALSRIIASYLAEPSNESAEGPVWTF